MFKRVLRDMNLQFKSKLGRISAITHMNNKVGLTILALICRCFTNGSGLLRGGDRVGGTYTNMFTYRNKRDNRTNLFMYKFVPVNTRLADNPWQID